MIELATALEYFTQHKDPPLVFALYNKNDQIKLMPAAEMAHQTGRRQQ